MRTLILAFLVALITVPSHAKVRKLEALSCVPVRTQFLCKTTDDRKFNATAPYGSHKHDQTYYRPSAEYVLLPATSYARYVGKEKHHVKILGAWADRLQCEWYTKASLTKEGTVQGYCAVYAEKAKRGKRRRQ